ncbi:MAG: MogA/MoaB family molybdenum cofactor biosynthesis protein [Halobacteriota archaeon]
MTHDDQDDDDHGHGDDNHGHGDDNHDHDGGDHDHGDHDHGDDNHGHGDGHGHHHHDLDSVGVAIVTVSTSRTLDDDPAGDVIAETLRDSGHEIVTRELLSDDFDGIQRAVSNLSNRGDVDAIVTTGGTGVTPDDVTIEAVESLFTKTLPGFGELFRSLSIEEIGTRTVGTRATAGVTNAGVVVFSLPGSENAARLGVESIIEPEVGHLAGLAGRGRDARSSDDE